MPLPTDPRDLVYQCINNCHEAIIIADAAANIQYINPAWTRIYGYTIDEVWGCNPRLLQSGKQDAAFYQNMWQALLDKQGNWQGDIIDRTKEGREVSIHLTITAIKNHLGENIGYMGTATEITENKDSRARLFQQDRLASIGLITSGLMHQLATPLTVALGHAGLAAQEARHLPELAKNIEIVIKQIQAISELSKSLMRFVRNNMENNCLSKVKLLEVIQGVLKLVKSDLISNKIEVQISVEAEFSVMADRQRLEQILLNLIMNAIHAIQQVNEQVHNGTNLRQILLQATLLKDSVPSERLLLTIKDTGCGIEPYNIRKIFQPHFTTKEASKGSGLGLPVAVRLLEEIGGQIEVFSIPKEGTTFSLYLNPA